MNNKILILCTGNSCRSQMAAGFLKSFDHGLEVYSAGVKPADKVNPLAVMVMKEAGIDISKNVPVDVNKYLFDSFEYLITVCDNAKETCPVFAGKVSHRIHIGFEDPADFEGTEEEKLLFYRKIRDEIKTAFNKFYKSQIKGL